MDRVSSPRRATHHASHQPAKSIDYVLYPPLEVVTELLARRLKRRRPQGPLEAGALGPSWSTIGLRDSDWALGSSDLWRDCSLTRNFRRTLMKIPKGQRPASRAALSSWRGTSAYAMGKLWAERAKKPEPVERVAQIELKPHELGRSTAELVAAMLGESKLYIPEAEEIFTQLFDEKPTFEAVFGFIDGAKEFYMR